MSPRTTCDYLNRTNAISRTDKQIYLVTSNVINNIRRRLIETSWWCELCCCDSQIPMLPREAWKRRQTQPRSQNHSCLENSETMCSKIAKTTTFEGNIQHIVTMEVLQTSRVSGRAKITTLIHNDTPSSIPSTNTYLNPNRQRLTNPRTYQFKCTAMSTTSNFSNNYVASLSELSAPTTGDEIIYRQRRRAYHHRNLQSSRWNPISHTTHEMTERNNSQAWVMVVKGGPSQFLSFTIWEASAQVRNKQRRSPHLPHICQQQHFPDSKNKPTSWKLSRDTTEFLKDKIRGAWRLAIDFSWQPCQYKMRRSHNLRCNAQPTPQSDLTFLLGSFCWCDTPTTLKLLG